MTADRLTAPRSAPPASRLARPLALAVLAVGCILALAAAPAWAARTHVFERSFGKAGSGAGEMELRGYSEGVAGSGVAVNSATGDVYVADTGNHRVDEFEADGAFVRAWGWGVAGGIEFESCTVSSLLGCKPGLPGTGAGEFEEPVFVAVDNSGGPSEGDVYVGDAGDDLITKFTAAGALVESWGVNGQLNGESASGTFTGPFVSLAGVAVDAQGDLDVFEVGRRALFRFAQSGVFVEDFEAPRGTQPAGLAVNAAGSFFKANGNRSIEEFGSGGVEIGQVTPEEEDKVDGTHTTGLAVDGASGALYVAEANDVRRYAFNRKGEVVEQGGGACPVLPNPGGSKSEVGCALSESFGSERLLGVSGVAVDTADETVAVADATAGDVVVFALQPATKPLVEEVTVSEVTDESALFAARIDPQSLSAQESAAGDLPVEEPTTYSFQYGECSSVAECASSGYEHEVSEPGAAIAPGFEGVEVELNRSVEGLRAGVAYHYRAVARNAHGATDGGERVFSTQGTGEFRLPDDRRWELVSPANKQGASVEPIAGANDEEGVVQAAADGDAMTYVTNAPTETGPAGYDNFLQAFSARGPDGGWSTKDLTVPHATSTGVTVGQGQEYRFFSEDLSHAAAQPFGAFTPCSNEAGEPRPCLSEAMREQSAVVQDTGSGVFTPIESGCPAKPAPCAQVVEENADVPEGSVLDSGPCVADAPCGPIFAGASPDLQHVILEGLTEWNAGELPGERLLPVSLLPPNKAEEVLYAEAPKLGDGGHSDGGWDARHAMSADGSRVVWENKGHLYVRLNATVREESPGCVEPDKACTIQADVGLTGGPEFQGANSEVSKVLFTDGLETTRGEKSLFEYEVSAAELVKIASGVLGDVIGESEDGSYVYFVSNAQLAAGAVAGDCGSVGTASRAEVEKEAASSCDLYVRHDGMTGLVAVLSGDDLPDWASDLEGLTARVSPDGRYLAFMSQRSLTGYDNRDSVSGEPDEEVFEYRAPENVGVEAGGLVCASCDPTGARPHGVPYRQQLAGGNEGNEDLPLAGGDRVWPGSVWLAANVPAWTPFHLGESFYQSRYLSDSGRLFFNASDGLVPKDVNGVGDVYEWEPAGVGSCSSEADTGSTVYRAAGAFTVEGREGESPAGCTSLISSGTSKEEAAFLDASESGGDVFFLTDAKLTSEKTDTSIDVFDAHECTSIAPCPPEAASPPPPCNTEASCKAAASPQPSIYGQPASATFSGPGNPSSPSPSPSPAKAETRAQKLSKALKACKRDRSKKKRKQCEAAAKHKYGATKKAHKAAKGGHR